MIRFTPNDIWDCLHQKTIHRLIEFLMLPLKLKSLEIRSYSLCMELLVRKHGIKHMLRIRLEPENLSLFETIIKLMISFSDDNVHYQQSMMLTRALEEADVLFQQLSYPDENHGIVGLRPHFYHSLSNFILNDCFGKNEVFKR